MNPATTIAVLIGVVIVAAGASQAMRFRARGGTAVYSRDWYVVVILSGVGGGVIAAALVPLLWSR